MHIKSVLLGTTTAVVLSTPVMAADAIVTAEPEPVEYVRVCDAFGEGYFYIPGSETCLKIGGYVRMRVSAPSASTELTYDEDTFSLDTTGGDSYTSSVRARLTVDAKSDTEWGALHSRLQFQADNDGTPGTDAPYGINQGYLQLGGLFAGYSESAWNTTTNGGASGFGGFGEFDGNYGYQQRNMLQYQFGSGNWFGAISLEDDADTSSWTPDVVLRAGTVFGSTTVFAVLGYDQDNGVDNDVWNALGGAAVGEGSDEFGVKLGLNTGIGAAGNLIVQGFYATGTTAYGANVDYLGQSWTPTWSILAGYSHDLTATTTAYINGQYFADFYDVDNTGTGDNAWGMSGGLAWTPVTNFTVKTEGKYLSVDGVDSDAVENDTWEVMLQLQRSF